MSKQEYKNRLSSLINDMMAAGANRFQILNALTEFTLDFMKDSRKPRDGKAPVSEKDGPET